MMTGFTLTKTRLVAGIWEGELTGAGLDEPVLSVTHDGVQVQGLHLERDSENGAWRVQLPIPANLISDGIQTFIISDADGHTLTSFALLSGEALAEDIRAEVNLLRSELNLLKQAFRAHCNNT